MALSILKDKEIKEAKLKRNFLIFLMMVVDYD